MAGVKISKLKNYQEVFHDENFDDKVNDMLIPVSLGNRTISVKMEELLRYLSIIDDQQNLRLDEQQEMILQNTDLINQHADELKDKLEEFKTENAGEHQNILDKASADKNELIQMIDAVGTGSGSQYEELNQKIDSNAQELSQKIDTLDSENQEQHKDIQSIIDENEQVTALSLIDLHQITEKIKLQLHDLKEEADNVHEQIKNDQMEIDAAQNERIEDIVDSITLWEIYGN